MNSGLLNVFLIWTEKILFFTTWQQNVPHRVGLGSCIYSFSKQNTPCITACTTGDMFDLDAKDYRVIDSQSLSQEVMTMSTYTKRIKYVNVVAVQFDRATGYQKQSMETTIILLTRTTMVLGKMMKQNLLLVLEMTTVIRLIPSHLKSLLLL